MSIEINKVGMDSAKSSRSDANKPNTNLVDAKNTDLANKTSNKELVSLTPEAKKLGRIHENLSSEAHMDVERVSQIKKSITEGTYQVNAEKLADNIIASEQTFDGEDV